MIFIPLIRSTMSSGIVMDQKNQIKIPSATKNLRGKTYHSLIMFLAAGISTLRCTQLHAGQHQKVVRYNRTPKILLKTSPPTPIATGKPKGTFEPRNSRLDSCPKVPQPPVNPVALHHLQHRKTSLLGKGNIRNSPFLGLLQIVLRSKTSIRRHLTRGPMIKSFLPFDQSRKQNRVIGIAALDHTIQNHPCLAPVKNMMQKNYR